MTPQQEQAHAIVEECYQNSSRDLWVRVITAALKKAVAAERERCAGIVKNRLGLWRGHGGNTKLESPYNHLTLEGELEIIDAAIREATP